MIEFLSSSIQKLGNIYTCCTFLSFHEHLLCKALKKKLASVSKYVFFFFRTLQIWKIKRNNCTGELTKCRKRYGMKNENQEYL